MALGEIHIQLAVNFAGDPKMRKLLRYGADARGIRDLYVQMTCYSKANLTDGFVPEEEVGVMCYPDSWENAQRDAGRLVDVGLVERADEGFVVCAFLKRNKSRSQLEEDARAAEQAAILGNHRRWHEAKGVANPDCPLCRPTSVPDVGGDRVPDRGGDVGGSSTESPETETETETETEDLKPLSPPATDDESAEDHDAVRSRREAKARHEQDTFDRFWAEYPRKDGKAEARKAWPKALKKTDVEVLIKAAGAYQDRMRGKSREHVKTPGPWLNAERWADELDDSGELRSLHANSGAQPFPWER